MVKSKKILVAPLDWVLGHATRCIPIIHFLIQADCKVIIAASGNTQKILKEQFPQATHVFLEGYQVKYAKKRVQLNFIGQLYKIFKAIRKEHRWMQSFIQAENIDAVISDNRYGLYSTNIPSVLITHQLNILGPRIMQGSLRFIVDYYLKKFTYCWVPDYDGKDNLAGILAHPKVVASHVKYLGPLSRFSLPIQACNYEEYDYLGIVSGPENQRTVFENALTNALQKINKKTLIICGLPQENFRITSGNITRVAHLNDEEFQTVIHNSKHVICRAGYSTIMDLFALQKGATLVPTPGQTEQEYLAEYLDGKHGFRRLLQGELSTKLASLKTPNSSSLPLPINTMDIVQSFLNES